MLIHQLFEQRADHSPDSEAILFQNKFVTYGDLNKRANQIAYSLINDGVRPGDIVGISLLRSVDLIASIIGVLKAGAAYLPLDESYPKDRLEFMKNESKAKLILTKEYLASSIENTLEISNPKVNVGRFAYVIFTSGSTGKPKGVALSHEALSNLIEWQNQEAQNSLRTLQFAPISFDVHFQEIFATLTTGGCLVLISEEQRLNPEELLNYIDKTQTDRLFLPFVALNQMAQMAESISVWPKNLRNVTTAGEQLKITPSIREFFRVTKASLHNHYGPSETHVVSSLTLNNDPSSWPSLPTIGKPIKGARFHFLDSNLNQVSNGEIGEIYLSGVCLADGYIHNTKLTDERFITHPSLGRMYKTGDLGKVESTGNINYEGRIDSQIKVRGFRVETNEIEAVLSDLGCSAAVKGFERDGIFELHAYVTGDTKDLRGKLSNLLPDYMIPKSIIQLEKLPLTASGKIDYKNLPSPSTDRPNLSNEYVAPRTEEEKLWAKIISKNLNIDSVGIHDDFFELGGNSLLAIKVMTEINLNSSKKKNILALFQDSTISKNLSQSTLLTKKRASVSHSPIAVIGMNGRFPGARNIDELWEKILKQENLIQLFDKSEAGTDSSFVNAGASLPGQKEFDAPYFGFTPREAEMMDPQQRKFLEIAHEALELAGVNFEEESNIGVFAGEGNSLYRQKIEQYPDKTESLGAFNVMLGLEKDYIATRVSHKLNLKGPSLSIHTGCSTSLVAIIEAVNSLRLGHCDIALAGGISISGSDERGYHFQEGGILSKDGKCRPFDSLSSGTVFTDGAGVVVLKRLDEAVESQDNILAVIKGVGLNNDGSNKMSFTAPSVAGQEDAILRAHHDAGISAEELSYIEAHGTATPVGDPIEIEALKNAFAQSTHKSNFCYVSSLKANTGHLTAAAGVAGLIKAIKVLQTGIVPGTAHLNEINPLLNLESSPFVITNENVKLAGDKLKAGVSSFGVGGTNAHIVIEKFIPQTSESADLNTIFKVSARTEEQLDDYINQVKSVLENNVALDQVALASTLEHSRKLHAFRATILQNGDVLKKNDAKKKIVFAFSGQGAQYAKMGLSLYKLFPVFKQVVDESAVILDTILDRSLKDILFSEDSEKLLNNTYYTQPAIFVLEYALAKQLLSMGLIPDLVIGHSVGEFVAATISGVFTPEDGLRIIAKRASLTREIPNGAMLSVLLDKEKALVLARQFDLDIAAINGYKNCVISGPIERIESLESELQSRAVGCIRVATSHAFHSRLMSPISPKLKSFMENIKLNAPQISFISTVTGKSESKLMLDVDYWSKHIERTVNFVEAVEQIDSNDFQVIEIGPQQILKNLIKKVNSKISVQSCLNGKINDEHLSLSRVCGNLWVNGHNLIFLPKSFKKVPAPTYPFSKKEYWLDDKNKMNKNSIGEIMDSSQSIEKKLIEIFEETSGLDVGSNPRSMSFIEMGMDSLFLTQIALKLKKELKVQINFRQLIENYPSIEALAKFYSDKMPKVEMPKVASVVIEPAKIETPKVTQTTMPAAPSAVVTQSSAINSDMASLVARQLEIMAQQLSLLQGNSVSPTVTASAETPKAVEVKSKAKASVSNAKEAFGACARITVEKTSDFSDKKKQMIDEFLTRYATKTNGSKSFTQINRKSHADPRAVTGFKPEWKEITYPIVVKKSLGQLLWDLDDNQYVDMTCGFGSNFFGNNNSQIKKIMIEQMNDGMEIGPQHPLTADVAKMINELTGNERSAFCNTGSEAVLGAMRIARTVTGREKIIVFSGSYHGINDEVIIRAGRDLKSFPASPGINPSAVSEMIVLDYGTTESLEKIRELAGDVAAVLVEPVQSRRCDFHPKEFLQEVRKICDQNDTCLIFDEVITGFRIHPGGAQAVFEVRADLCTYGKIVGGGMPIGVISGKSKYMDALDGGDWQYGDESTPTVGVTYFAGTFVRHPLTLAAAKGALEIIKNGGVALYEELNRKAAHFTEELNLFLQLSGVPLKMDRFGSLMKPKWKTDVSCGELLYAHLRFHGVHTYDGFPWFVNLAHTDEQLKFVLQAFKKSIADMQFLGLLPMSEVNIDTNFKEKSSKVIDPSRAPVVGAMLGRDEHGNPAWFLKNDTGGFNRLEV
ncbi:MAG: amino acid adenylation domain-containing protein [Bacteriovoracaceae bacterium]|nr:amino acid adenylation domain-containing protein [Bacteriovoracaceae bacterium]